MNGRVAKLIRRQVYGEKYSPRHRDYKANVRAKEGFVKGVKRMFKSMTIFDAGLRSAYQKAKREYNRRRRDGTTERQGDGKRS